MFAQRSALVGQVFRAALHPALKTHHLILKLVIDHQILKVDRRLVLSEVIAGRNWGKGVAEGNLFSTWSQIVGQEIASHTNPISLVDGKLTIQSSSTAWATQMRLMQEDLLKTISNSAPGALVEELNVLGPNAPSWKRGLRSIKGARGPRDTYG